MRIVIQRVLSAHVSVDQQVVGICERGLVVFAALGHSDTIETCKKAIEKVHSMKLFDDGSAFMAKTVDEVEGKILLVSQFTLLANLGKGRRPSFSDAMPPLPAKALFDQLEALWRERHSKLQTGRFGADMQVSLVNDGPVTLILDID